MQSIEFKLSVLVIITVLCATAVIVDDIFAAGGQSTDIRPIIGYSLRGN